ncbi:hypothetical protein K4K56_002647 [Colletotrichum sp. SAR 10_98]|nr:hypothetical protein K4K56_002647 [Colletotrichum sp. SAR 10_98]
MPSYLCPTALAHSNIGMPPALTHSSLHGRRSTLTRSSPSVWKYPLIFSIGGGGGLSGFFSSPSRNLLCPSPSPPFSKTVGGFPFPGFEGGRGAGLPPPLQLLANPSECSISNASHSNPSGVELPLAPWNSIVPRGTVAGITASPL